MPPKTTHSAALLAASSDVMASISDFKQLTPSTSSALLHRTLDYAVDRAVRPTTYVFQAAS